MKDQIEGDGAMKKDKRPERSKDTRSPMEIKNALERTPDKDLLSARHREYVGQLLDLLSRKRLDKMMKRGIQRTDVTPEIAHLGMLMARTIFDHLVIASQDELDAGACDIESLWAYLMEVLVQNSPTYKILWKRNQPRHYRLW